MDGRLTPCAVLTTTFLISFSTPAFPCNVPYADSDGDGDVDQVDFAALQRCLADSPGTFLPACACFDRTQDSEVNTADIECFMECASGPGVAADPLCERWPSGIASDDFNSYNLNPAIWSVQDPLGDAAVSISGTGSADSRLVISVPAGLNHGVWTDGISAPHILQQATDTDFEVDIKFESTPSAAYNTQGLLVKQDSATYMRFDFYSTGSETRFYSAYFNAGAYTQFQDRSVSAASTAYLSVARQGSNWTAWASADGNTWTTLVQFTRSIQVSQVGLFIGSEAGSGPAPAYTGIVDYFKNTSAAMVPLDGVGVQDRYAPNLFAIEAVPEETGFIVRWSTDEPATSRLDYGVTTGYELGFTADPSFVLNHYERLTGLGSATLYHVRITSSDATGNPSSSVDIPLVTTSTVGGPVLDVWYGLDQVFGQLGTPQPAVNILGNASDTDAVISLSYSLNHEPFVPLSQGPNLRRLAQPGDFNADVFFNDLQTGANPLLLRGVDGLHNVNLRIVNVNKASASVWPLPYSIDWSQVSSINDAAQIIDGLWTLEPSSVRPVIMDYDRLIAIGDLTWQDYEVTVPIVVHAVDPGGYDWPSNGPAVGVLCRWPGHSNDGSQPWQGIYPLGGIGLYRWTTSGNRYQIFGNNGFILAQAPLSDVLQLDVLYMFKFRVVTVGTSVNYSFKVWPAAQAEPSAWKLTGQQSVADDPGSGSALLLAHHVDASFGNVTIVPGPFP